MGIKTRCWVYSPWFEPWAWPGCKHTSSVCSEPALNTLFAATPACFRRAHPPLGGLRFALGLIAHGFIPGRSPKEKYPHDVYYTRTLLAGEAGIAGISGRRRLCSALNSLLFPLARYALWRERREGDEIAQAVNRYPKDPFGKTVLHFFVLFLTHGYLLAP